MLQTSTIPSKADMFGTRLRAFRVTPPTRAAVDGAKIGYISL
jgi:hypothetical protein